MSKICNVSTLCLGETKIQIGLSCLTTLRNFMKSRYDKILLDSLKERIPAGACEKECGFKKTRNSNY